MRRSAWILTLAVVASVISARAPVAEPGGKPPDTGYVVLCRITGMIDDGMAVVVDRAVREAAGASAMIFLVDTPGGLVDAAINITNTILKAPCPTIAFADGMGAISAGALISYACDHIIMSPAANIGASTPYNPAATGSEMVTEKSMSFLRAKYRALAELKGHSPALGEGMVDNTLELWGYRGEDGTYTIYKVRDDSVVGVTESKPSVPDPVDQFFKKLGEGAPIPMEPIKKAARKALGAKSTTETEPMPGKTRPLSPGVDRGQIPQGARLISSAGELVTLTAGDAKEFGLIPAVVNDVDGVLRQYGYAGLGIHEIVPTWSEALFRWLSSSIITSLLLLVGFGGIYFEVRTPGFGLPGIIGISAFALFFGAQYLIGLANWIDVLLVLLGVGLLMVEVLVLPGFGVVGLLGIISMIAGFYLALTRVVIPQYDWEFQRLESAGASIITAMACFLVLAWATWKFLPRTRLFHALVQEGVQRRDDGYTVQTSDVVAGVVGMRGVSTSMLRPAGRGRFEDRTLDVVTRGEYIPKGRPIRVIQATGNRFIVAECGEEDPG